MTDTDRQARNDWTTASQQHAVRQADQALTLAGRWASRSGVIRPSVISSEKLEPKSGFALVGHRPPGAAFLEGLAPPAMGKQASNRPHASDGLRLGCHVMFCFSTFASALCWDWAGLQLLARTSSALCSIESIKHIHTHTHARTMDQSTNCCCTFRRHHERHHHG